MIHLLIKVLLWLKGVLYTEPLLDKFDKGTFCRTRGHLSDKGTFCRTRGHLSDKGTFLSDKGTFFVGQGDIQCKPAYGPSRPVGQDINLEMLHKPEGNQYQPTCKVSLKLVQWFQRYRGSWDRRTP